MKAYNSTGYSSPSSVFTFTTSTDPPTNLAVSNITHNSYTVTWSLAQGATNYYIKINTGPFNVVAGGATADTFSASGVASGTLFNIVVASNSSYTATSSISFYTKPRTVTNVQVTQIKSTSVFVSWNAVSPAPTNYAVGLQDTDGNILQWNYTTGPTPTNITISGLIPSTSYKVIVVAVNPDSTTGVDSNPASFTTAVLAAPTNLTSSLLRFDGFTISWTAVEEASNYYLSVDDGISYPYVLDSSNIVEITGLQSETTYSIRVKSYVNGVYSDPSSSISATTTEPPPDAPTNLYADSIGTTNFTIIWTQTGDTTGLTYTYTLNGSTPASLGVSVTTSGTSATFSGVTSNTSYNVSVQAENTYGTRGPVSINIRTLALVSNLSGGLSYGRGSWWAYLSTGGPNGTNWGQVPTRISNIIGSSNFTYNSTTEIYTNNANPGNPVAYIYNYNGIVWCNGENYAYVGDNYIIYPDGTNIYKGANINNLVLSTSSINPNFNVAPQFGGGFFSDMAFNGTIWVGTAVSNDYFGSNRTAANLYTSTNGLNWTGVVSPWGSWTSSAEGIAVKWNGTYFLAIGNFTNKITISTDGINWTSYNTSVFPSTITAFNNTGRFVALVWNGSYWLAGFVSGVYKSFDGITWTASPDFSFTGFPGPLNNPCAGLAWNGSYWLGMKRDVRFYGGPPQTICTSTDGLTWTDIFSVP